MASAKKPAGEIEAFRAALGAVRGKTARSSLYRWLRAHHDQFLEDWTEAADWPAFAEAFAALGLADRTGKPPIPETARKTWAQVRKDVAKAKARQLAKRAPLLAPGEIAPGVRAVEPAARTLATQVLADAPRPRINLDIRIARPRLETLAAETQPAARPDLAAARDAPPSQIESSKSHGGSLTDEEFEAEMRRLVSGKQNRPPELI